MCLCIVNVFKCCFSLLVVVIKICKVRSCVAVPPLSYKMSALTQCPVGVQPSF